MSANISLQEAHIKAAKYYVQIATAKRPSGRWKRIAEVQPLIEAVWQYSKAGKYQEAYQLMVDENLFGNLRLWGANTDLLELCQLLVSGNWQWEPRQKSLIISNFASVSNTLGQKQQALDYYGQALAIRREVGDRAGEGATLNNLGHVYDDLGQKQQALDYYGQALAICREVGDRAGEGTTLHNIGTVFAEFGQFAAALACFLLAKALFEYVQNPSYIEIVVQWITSLQDRQGEEQFASLLAQVEGREEEIVQMALQDQTIFDE